MTDQPWFVVVGGINGAGKTTTSEILQNDVNPRRLTFLNPDLETAQVLVADPTLTQNAANFRGLRIVREVIKKLFVTQQSLVVETVFANQAYLRLMERAEMAADTAFLQSNQAYLRLMERAEATGCGVRLLFFGLQSPEQSIRRVAMRVARGGHDVPEADIRRRWPLVHENLTRAVKIADAVSVYDSHLDGQPPRLIATARNGQVSILDRDALSAVTAALDAAG